MRRLLPALLLSCAAPAAAQMYKCVDARGVTHYGDKPGPGCRNAQEVDIRGQPPISGGTAPKAVDLKVEERAFQVRRIERERQEQAEAQAREAQKRRCANVQSELHRLALLRRVPDAAAHDARIAQLKSEQAQKCR